MEPAQKMKPVQCILIISISLILVCACASSPPEPIIIIQDPLVLQEVAPLPRVVIEARKAVTEYEPVYANFRIIEVSEVNGVQQYIIARMGQDKTGIVVGATGDIGEDATFQRIIGTYKIIELEGNFFRCEITELAYRIGTNAYVRIKTGEKVKEPTTN